MSLGGSGFEARLDSFADVAKRVFFATALRGAAGEGGAFGYPKAVFILLQRYEKFRHR